MAVAVAAFWFIRVLTRYSTPQDQTGDQLKECDFQPLRGISIQFSTRRGFSFEHMMQLDAGAICNAVHDECGANAKSTVGVRNRHWETRVSTIGLRILKLRRDDYFPAFLKAVANRPEDADRGDSGSR